jgi:triacylglycerol lipase
MHGDRNPVLLIHGIDDTAVLFHRLRPYLEQRGWRVHDLDLVPNNGAAGLDELALQIDSYAKEHFAGEPAFDLVGFSMGGMVARYYVQRLARPGGVQRLVTISSPHRGTWTGFLRNNNGARQMRPGSEFLRELHEERHALAGVCFTSIWNPFDLMILPASSSAVAEARSVRVKVAAHPLMMRSRRVMRLVEDALLSASF